MARRRPQPRLSVRPHHCVVLGIDGARASGWSIWADGVYWWSGEIKGFRFAAMQDVVAKAQSLRKQRQCPAFLLLEDVFGRNRGALLSLGGARALWQTAWVEGGGVKSHQGRVMASRWAGKVLGKGWGAARSEQRRPQEQRYAASIAGRAVGPDEAPSICIAYYGCHSSIVGDKLPQRFREAA